MFSIKFNTASFDNLNTRIELHGDEKKPAADIGLSMSLDANILDYFHSELKHLLFQEYANVSEDDLFNGEEEKNEGVVDWRFRDLKKIDWDYDGVGYRFVIWAGIGGTEEEKPEGIEPEYREDVVLIQTTVNKFKFKPLNEGKVEVSFKVSGYPSPKEIGRLFELQGEIIDISLEPPSL